MQTAVTILRDLWARRLWVVLFALVAILLGALVAYRPSLPPKSRKYEVGVASMRILVDTPDSQVVAIAGEGGGGGDLGGHTSLLAQLMAEGEAKGAIARAAGISPDNLDTVAPTPDDKDPGLADLRDSPTEILLIKTVTNDNGDQLP